MSPKYNDENNAAATPQPKEFFDIYRDYVKHEDSLINWRTTWFITIQSFLIGIFGLSYTKKYESIYNLTKDIRNSQFKEIHLHQELLFSSSLLALCVVGFVTSFIALSSITAASNSIDSLKAQWRNQERKYYCNFENVFEFLPAMTGGGSTSADLNGSRFSRWLPISMGIMWICAFLFVALDYYYTNRHIEKIFSINSSKHNVATNIDPCYHGWYDLNSKLCARGATFIWHNSAR